MSTPPIEILYEDGTKNKCFRCGEPATKQITIGMDGKSNPFVVHVCDKVPGCTWNSNVFKINVPASSTIQHRQPPPK
jgi:hypothetical protein